MGSFFFEEGGNKSRRENLDTGSEITGRDAFQFLVAVLISHQVSLIEQPKTFVYRYLLVR